MLHVIRMIVVGLIVGILARFFYPGPVHIGIVMSVILGIAGSFVGGLTDMAELLELARAGAVPPIPICECALEDANAALTALKEGRRVGRTVLRPGGPRCEAV